MGIALVSVPAPHQSLLSQRPNISSNTWLHGSATTSIRYPSKLTIPHCSSSISVVEEGLPPPPPPPDSLPVQSESATNDTDKLPLRGCKACGREEIENGCNGEGRIQGGIATFPGFGWWPIKAYRPCPGFVASGGRYTRRGQSMDEVAFGRGGRGAAVGTSGEVQSSKRSQGPSKFKR
ncbi:uncharacterized protein LOC115975264 [Quercus lobata]|uniref:Uncharacterized protein n=1 Tax=Quercus lobata TaxID=97700 RepID=A0A7N2KV85_QUELO|nr:uncharacterized protein LOC115975264 [Quercus lobata]